DKLQCANLDEALGLERAEIRVLRNVLVNGRSEFLQLAALRFGQRHRRLDQDVVGIGRVGLRERGRGWSGSGRVKRNAVDGNTCHCNLRIASYRKLKPPFSGLKTDFAFSAKTLLCRPCSPKGSSRHEAGEPSEAKHTQPPTPIVSMTPATDRIYLSKPERQRICHRTNVNASLFWGHFRLNNDYFRTAS